MNVIERNPECTFHRKSAANVHIKFLLFYVFKFSEGHKTTATEASLYLERSACFRGYGVQEWQSLF